MSIQELSAKFKGILKNTDYLLTALIVVVSLISFALGRLSVEREIVGKNDAYAQFYSGNGGNTLISTSAPMTSGEEMNIASPTAAQGYVASKSGTKYHLPWCGSAKQIKEENKIWFATKEEAERAGYSPASNCKGI